MNEQIPFELRSLNAEEAGQLLGYKPRTIREKLACRPDFPRRCDHGGEPRWIAGALMKWRNDMSEARAGRPNRRRSFRNKSSESASPDGQ